MAQMALDSFLIWCFSRSRLAFQAQYKLELRQLKQNLFAVQDENAVKAWKFGHGLIWNVELLQGVYSRQLVETPSKACVALLDGFPTSLPAATLKDLPPHSRCGKLWKAVQSHRVGPARSVKLVHWTVVRALLVLTAVTLKLSCDPPTMFENDLL